MEEQALVPIVENKTDLVIARAPDLVLQEAQKAAKALQDVIANKKNPFMLHGEQYIEADDWQLIGKFYGVTAKVKEVVPIEIGEASGFRARAVVVRLSDGLEISAAESMCLNDEANWSSKPTFQLSSMAQTRACAKALRNVLAWVVMLAGYKTTPSEELNNETSVDVKPQASATGVKYISEKQRKLIFGKAKEKGLSPAEIKTIIFRVHGREDTADINNSELTQILAEIQSTVFTETMPLNPLDYPGDAQE